MHAVHIRCQSLALLGFVCTQKKLLEVERQVGYQLLLLVMLLCYHSSLWYLLLLSMQRQALFGVLLLWPCMRAHRTNECAVVDTLDKICGKVMGLCSLECYARRVSVRADESDHHFMFLSWSGC